MRTQHQQALLRQRFPLPAEQVEQLAAHKVKHFLFALRGCHSRQLEAWVDSLPANRLCLVFEALLEAKDKNTINRLFLIVERHAGWYLYAFGWNAMQRYFPHPLIMQAFRLLCYEIYHRHIPRPYFYKADVLLEVLENPKELDLFYALFNHLEAAEAEKLEELRLAYGFREDALLWQALLGHYFRLCPETELYAGRARLRTLLPILQFGQIESILERVVYSESFTIDQKEEIAGEVLEALPVLSPSHEIWLDVKPDVHRFFHRLAISLNLHRHCINQPLKSTFYQPHMVRIRDLAKLGDGVLALRFPGFVLIDPAEDPEHLYYYTNPLLMDWMEHGYSQEALARPLFPLHTIGPAGSCDLYRKEPALRICLKGEEAKEAQRFLNSALGENLRLSQDKKNRGWLG